MLTQAFIKRDGDGRWQAEVKEVAEATGAEVLVVEKEAHALQYLQSRSGIIFAPSESGLPPHKIVHDILRSAPASFVTVTLQHGYECVGFLQSREHDLAHGRENIFAADVICGWCESERLTSVIPSQRSKLFVTGPTSVLQRAPRQASVGRGIVCENLHSIRLSSSPGFKVDFGELFGQFCEELASKQQGVTLRPHPAGQYTLKNGIALADNVVINNDPIYKVNLTGFSYGISAPSSIIIDMVLAGIPTAVWVDKNGTLDTDNYSGLAQVSDLSDWLQFAEEASAHPERFIQQQERFIKDQKMLVEPREVYRRYADLIWSAARRASPGLSRPPAPTKPERRILFVSNSHLPTLQLAFVKPLKPLVEAGHIATEFLTEQHLKDAFGKNLDRHDVRSWIVEKLATVAPSMIVFCRYSGPHASLMTEWARERDIPTMFHIDDDLLNIPLDLGASKHAYHNDPMRVGTVRYLLNETDLVYCSNPNLRDRLLQLGASAPLKSGKIYASGHVIVPATEKPVRKIGYMASADHTHNLEMIMEAVTAFLRSNPDVHFELFGSIPQLAAFDEFGDRVSKRPQISNYEQFMSSFATSEWDIGICPLVKTPFNVVKSNTKWVEYTSIGAAVIASKGTVYDECCADECGILASNVDEWVAGLNRLANDPSYRFDLVRNAQQKLANEYTTDKLREQVLSFFAEAEASKGKFVRQIAE
ncbi:glycosyltransferase [Rhizobium sp. XQZ8]|uniref:glycosyltransferase family protein n=1 Tax=Rhizobium populisoli TaxID=2859785 RepID=UPI001CA53562|nr:glycosyltransferase [Rhizobium populisoli]MBW6423197.1 glycosyltransferase [Rhizobium populisoli]